jgi:hypothetical protein
MKNIMIASEKIKDKFPNFSSFHPEGPARNPWPSARDRPRQSVPPSSGLGESLSLVLVIDDTKSLMLLYQVK